MKRVLLFTTIFSLFASTTVGQSLIGVGHEGLLIGNSALPITVSTYTPSEGGIATRCMIMVESADIRYSTDGTAPTASVGHPAVADSTFIVPGESIALWLGIRSGGSDAGLQVSCYRGDGPIPDPTPKAVLLSGVTSTATSDPGVTCAGGTTYPTCPLITFTQV